MVFLTVAAVVDIEIMLVWFSCGIYIVFDALSLTE